MFLSGVLRDVRELLALKNSALVKLSRDNLSNLWPHPLYSFWHYSHPTLRERLAAIRGDRLDGASGRQ